ncbi:MAG TPA: DUF1003 domain-containing protein [Flavisolibacter sp.]|jgi:uncharacterized membrane protein|nr:DUF1003 domain-containing protein [Flavisolibacter sp.]
MPESVSLDAILETENQQLKKLNDIVIRSIEEEKLISQKLFSFEEDHPGFASKISDRIASFGGSWYFIGLFLLVMVLWIAANIYWLGKPFDPYPFILLNLLLSTIAALQAPVLLMSQNRKEAKDRQRATNDYMINLKAEIEVRHLQEKLDLLIAEQMKTLFEIQELQLQMISEIRSNLKTSGV